MYRNILETIGYGHLVPVSIKSVNKVVKTFIRKSVGDTLLDKSEDWIEIVYTQDDVKRIIVQHIEKNTGVILLDEDVVLGYQEVCDYDDEAYEAYCCNFSKLALEKECNSKIASGLTLKEYLGLNFDFRMGELDDLFMQILVDEFKDVDSMAMRVNGEDKEFFNVEVNIPMKYFVNRQVS